jgi:succinate-acetate transporter protein
MSDQSDQAPAAPASNPPQPGVGVSLSVGVFGFSVLVLGLAQARIYTPNAVGIFVPVAMGLGAFGLLFGGYFELRANNVFAGTFSFLYAGFLLATGLILRTFSPGIVDAAGSAGFGDAFVSWLLLWCVFTAGLTLAAYHINMPAFLAFALLAIAYLLLGVANVSDPGNFATFLSKAGGWVLIADGLCAWYLSWGLAVNAVIGDRIPLFPYPYSSAPAQEAPADVTPLPVA